SAVDQDRRSRADAIDARQQHVRGDAFDKHRGRSFIGNGFRQHDRTPGRQVSFRCIGADWSAGICDPVADLWRGDFRAYRRHHTDRFDTRYRRRRQGVKPHALVDIDEVDADGGLTNPDFVRFRGRKLDSRACELVDAAGRPQSDNIGHVNAPLARALCRPPAICEIPRNCRYGVRFCTMSDWEDLRHFMALARQGTLSAAARLLGVDHATVARRVAALEADTGLKLIDRRARNYQLTDDGRRIAATAMPMEEAAFAVGRAVKAAKPGVRGEVSISSPRSLANALIAPQLFRLRQRHPGIRIKLIGEKRTASLNRREADVALRLSRPHEPGLIARKIGSFGFGLYGAP